MVNPHNKGMKKDANKGRTVRSNLHTVMEGRKNARHVPRADKRKASKLRNEINKEMNDV